MVEATSQAQDALLEVRVMTTEDKLQQVAKALRAATAELWKAESAASLWADKVSKAVKDRLGLGPSDERRWQDPDYAAAVDLYAKIQEARKLVEQLAEQAVLDGQS